MNSSDQREYVTPGGVRIRHFSRLMIEGVGLDAIREKVTALFPEHEIETFTEHFWTLIQRWREEEGKAP